MAQSFLLHSALLPKDSVELGRLVTDVRSPQNRFLGLPITPSDRSIQQFDKFKDKLRHSGGSQLKAFLTSLLSAQFGGVTETAIDIESASCITQQLRNCETWFETHLSGSEEAKEWLGKVLWGGKKVYLVVGLKILVDARICEREGRLIEAGVGLQLPTSATGLSLPGANADTGFGISNLGDHRQLREFTASGEHIFAIQYRKIQFSWFFSRDIQDLSLQKNRWKICWGADRTLEEEEEEEEEDVVEATAADPLGKGDIEQGCDSFQVDDEEFIFLS